MRAAVTLLGLALLAGCGSRNDDVGGVTPDEDRMLNEAAASLDVNYMAAPANNVDANATEAGNAQ